jgi:hypothetical protein
LGHAHLRVAAGALDLRVLAFEREGREAPIVVIEEGLLEARGLVAEITVTGGAGRPGRHRRVALARDRRQELPLVDVRVAAAARRPDRLVADKRGPFGGFSSLVATGARGLLVLAHERESALLVVVELQVGKRGRLVAGGAVIDVLVVQELAPVHVLVTIGARLRGFLGVQDREAEPLGTPVLREPPADRREPAPPGGRRWDGSHDRPLRRMRPGERKLGLRVLLELVAHRREPANGMARVARNDLGGCESA